MALGGLNATTQGLLANGVAIGSLVKNQFAFLISIFTFYLLLIAPTYFMLDLLSI
jgi:hypothetical protein